MSKVLAMSVILATLITGCGTKSKTITGTFTLTDKDISRTFGCKGTGGYSDIQSGLKVVVKSGSGRILGISHLGPDNYSGKYSGVVCQFPFEVTDLPSSKFYSVEVGRRGSMEYSKEQLEKQDWNVQFSMG